MNVLITGANRGIGLELARLCASLGYRVFAGSRSVDRANELKALSEQYLNLIKIIPMEISDETSLDTCLEMVLRETDSLDLLINNAGINDGEETVRTFDAQKAVHVMMTNAISPIMVVQKFLGLLKAGTNPKVIMISSESGSISGMEKFRGYTYFGSKAALNMFTRCLAWDPEAAGIISVTLHPGWVRTDMGGPTAHLSVTESATGILNLATRLAQADNGKFFTWEGKEFPW